MKSIICRIIYTIKQSDLILRHNLVHLNILNYLFEEMYD